MPDKQHFTTQQIITALEHTRGLVFLAARHLGCTPATVQNYCKRYKAVQQAKEDARAELLDAAELQLIHAVERGEMWAVMFALRTLGKDRGYSTRHEVTGKDGGPIEHTGIRLWEERLQAAHRRLQAEREAIRAQRALNAGHNGLAALPEGQGKGSVDGSAD